jgi:L-2-hydroxyglutarate oxidase LhgO
VSEQQQTAAVAGSVDHIDCLVIGAGVVGLAIARALAQAGLEVIVAEREGLIGSGVSARNSEVIHAGLYYPPGSLKARLCVRGKAMLYEFCASRGVAHQRCGKLLVATREKDVPQLEVIRTRAEACGVTDLRLLTAAEARVMEPALSCVAALWSPSSGIVDSHGLMTSLLADAEAAGATLALASHIDRAERQTAADAGGESWLVHMGAGDEGEDFALQTRWIVNAAGLDSQAVAHAMEGFPAEAIPARHIARGDYFSLSGRAPFSRLIYPMPVDGGMGVHLTLDIGGQARFGPDVTWLPASNTAAGRDLDYAVDARHADAFTHEVRRYWPALPAGALQPAYSGIRPKISGPGEPAADFCIAGPAHHGCPGVVQLFGIESPGLTSCMAIGEMVAGMVSGTQAIAGR